MEPALPQLREAFQTRDASMRENERPARASVLQTLWLVFGFHFLDNVRRAGRDERNEDALRTPRVSCFPRHPGNPATHARQLSPAGCDRTYNAIQGPPE